MAQCPRCGGPFGRDHYGDDIGHVRYCRHCGPRFTPAQRDAIAALNEASTSDAVAADVNKGCRIETRE